MANRKAWNLKRWIEHDLGDMDEEMKGSTFELLDPLSLSAKELQALYAALNPVEPKTDSTPVDETDDAAVTAEQTAAEQTAAAAKAAADEMKSLRILLPRIIRRHNFVDEAGTQLPQFDEEPELAEDMPMYLVRYIVGEFQALSSPDRELFPKRSATAS